MNLPFKVLSQDHSKSRSSALPVGQRSVAALADHIREASAEVLTQMDLTRSLCAVLPTPSKENR